MGSGLAQLVERLIPIPEVRSSNPDIGIKLFLLNICLLSSVYWKDENKEKEAGDGPFLKKIDDMNISYQLKSFRLLASLDVLLS